MTTQRHGNIDKEWSITKNVMSEKMEDIFFQTDFFVFLYKINWIWKLGVMLLSEIFEILSINQYLLCIGSRVLFVRMDRLSKLQISELR